MLVSLLHGVDVCLLGQPLRNPQLPRAGRDGIDLLGQRLQHNHPGRANGVQVVVSQVVCHQHARTVLSSAAVFHGRVSWVSQRDDFVGLACVPCVQVVGQFSHAYFVAVHGFQQWLCFGFQKRLAAIGHAAWVNCLCQPGVVLFFDHLAGLDDGFLRALQVDLAVLGVIDQLVNVNAKQSEILFGRAPDVRLEDVAGATAEGWRVASVGCGGFIPLIQRVVSPFLNRVAIGEKLICADGFLNDLVVAIQCADAVVFCILPVNRHPIAFADLCRGVFRDGAVHRENRTTTAFERANDGHCPAVRTVADAVEALSFRAVEVIRVHAFKVTQWRAAVVHRCFMLSPIVVCCGFCLLRGLLGLTIFRIHCRHCPVSGLGACWIGLPEFHVLAGQIVARWRVAWRVGLVFRAACKGCLLFNQSLALGFGNGFAVAVKDCQDAFAAGENYIVAGACAGAA